MASVHRIRFARLRSSIRVDAEIPSEFLDAAEVELSPLSAPPNVILA